MRGRAMNRSLHEIDTGYVLCRLNICSTDDWMKKRIWADAIGEKCWEDDSKDAERGIVEDVKQVKWKLFELGFIE